MLTVKNFTKYIWILLPCLFISAIATVSPAHAAGESYAWENKNKDTILVSGGDYSVGFSLSKISGGNFSDSGGVARDKVSGCLIFVDLKVLESGKGTATFSIDTTSALADSQCNISKAADLSKRFDSNITVDSKNSGLEPITNYGLKVESITTGGEFPSENDTITITNDKEKKVATKKTSTKTEGGFVATFDNIPLGQYTACSKVLDLCVDFRQIDSGNPLLPSKTVTISKDLSTSSCSIDGIGWIICPVMNALAKWNDAAFGFLDNLLTIRPELLQDKGTLVAWQRFRDIANVLFVIAFLIIIYSQITSVGISNYGVKKLIPKLIISAILVNASYILCQLAVDISNILGSGMYQLLGNGIQVGVDGAATGPSGWEKFMGFALAGAAVVLLVIAIMLAPTALLAFMIILLIVVARQALVILLIVVAPIAFVAYLLPNTEQWFKKWWKAFVATLMVFPIIGIVFGASTLASKILMGIAGDAGNADGTGTGDDQLLAIVALGVQAIPLFAVPALLKGSLSAAGSVGAKISGMADRSQNRAVKSVGSKSKEVYGNSAFARGRSARKAGKEAYKTQRYAEGVSGTDKGILGRARRRASLGVTGQTFTKGGAFAQERALGSAVAASHKAANEAVEHEEGLLSEMAPDELISEMGKGSVERQAAVIRRIAKIGGDQHVQSAYDHLMKANSSGVEGTGDVQQLAADALLSRKPAGLGASEASGLRNGSLSSTGGYMGSLKQRISDRKLGAKDYAAMGTDDLHRLAELSEKGDLTADDIKHISDMHAAIEADETLKGSLTGERQALFGSIVLGTGPMKADGTRRNDLTPL
jgi:hypothetical protein